MTADLVLVGGGLANSLVAYHLAVQRPDLDIVILERGTTLGGHHTWSFHEHDLDQAQWSWVRPLVDAGEALEIRAGRHPVVEPLLAARGAGEFVPNDTQLDTPLFRKLNEIKTGEKKLSADEAVSLMEEYIAEIRKLSLFVDKLSVEK